MAQQKDAVNFEDTLTRSDSRAEWHPYSVWREQIHSDEKRESRESEPNTEMTGSWKPLSVWQKQIKRA